MLHFYRSSILLNWFGYPDQHASKKADIVGKNLWEEIGVAIPEEFQGISKNAFIQGTPTYFEEYCEKMGEWFDVITCHCHQTVSISFRIEDRSADSKHSHQQLESRNELYRLHKILSEGSVSVWEDEYKFQRADGNYAYVHDRAHIIYDVDMVAVRMIGATQDITARKSIEIKLLDSERELVQEKLSRQKAVTLAVLAAQESERAEIGKELHDKGKRTWMKECSLPFLELCRNS